MTQQIPDTHPSDHYMIHICHGCGDVINWKPNPCVSYMVAGTPDGAHVDLEEIHPGLAKLLQKPIARVQMCAECWPATLARLLAETAPAADPEKGEPQSVEG